MRTLHCCKNALQGCLQSALVSHSEESVEEFRSEYLKLVIDLYVLENFTAEKMDCRIVSTLRGMKAVKNVKVNL